MIILMLLTALTGSLATAGALALHGASWMQIGAGYLAGGWVGMLVAAGFCLLMLGNRDDAGDFISET